MLGRYAAIIQSKLQNRVCSQFTYSLRRYFITNRLSSDKCFGPRCLHVKKVMINIERILVFVCVAIVLLLDGLVSHSSRVIFKLMLIIRSFTRSYFRSFPRSHLKRVVTLGDWKSCFSVIVV